MTLERILYTAKAHTTGGRDGGASHTTHGVFGLAARLKVSLPGLERQTAQALVEAAHQVCPYSHATRGNIDVTITAA